MKAEIEFKVNQKGEPYIEIIHRDKTSDDPEQNMLKAFMDKGTKQGILIAKVSGFSGYKASESHSKYHIVIKSEA